MKLYQDNGYFNSDYILGLDLNILVVIGGRGTGKTFNVLKTVITQERKFMLMRRTQAQLDMINKKQFSPVNPIADFLNMEIDTKPISKYNAAYIVEDREIGYTCALTTVSNMRGFDASEIDVLIYDEFIPEKHERPIKFEGTAFFNAYETMNRNRELTGKKPIQIVLLSNSNDIYNPILAEMGIITKVFNMAKAGQTVSIDGNKKLGIFLLSNSPISVLKRNTSLYKISENSDFVEMALNNSFCGVDDDTIKPQNLKEYKPLANVGELYLYTHKSTSVVYVSKHRGGTTPLIFRASDRDLKRFRKTFSWLPFEIGGGMVLFEDVSCQYLLTKYLQ